MQSWPIRIGALCLTLVVLGCGSAALAADSPSAVAPLMKLLQSGKVPESNRERIISLICAKGNAADLAYILEQVLQPEVWPAELRMTVLKSLREAAVNRKVIPDQHREGIAAIIESDNSELRSIAISLAGTWKEPAAAKSLTEISLNPSLQIALRAAALEGLSQVDRATARTTIASLLDGKPDFETRSFAITTLLRIAPEQAADLAATALADAAANDDPAVLMDAFLNSQGGADQLATALAETTLGKDVALMALRHMYSVGRSDQHLSDVLSEFAGIAEEMPLPTKEELATLIEEVWSDGDPARGEAVFRRKDLSCMKCHAVSKAGGQVGPDLSAVGSSSPVEYLAMSVLDPDQAIKEAYITKIVLTDDGKVVQGIIADQSDDTLVLKDPAGELHSIAKADIEDQIDGKSLMPKGLVKFMTRRELIDLIRFLSELGKPGDYAIRQTQRVQRWRVLVAPSPGLTSAVPNILQFGDEVYSATNWQPVYARVNGELPLEEAATQAKSDILYLYGEIQVTQGGPAQLSLKPAPGLDIWIDRDVLSEGATGAVDLTSGVQRITLRIDPAVYEPASVLLELQKPAGSAAEFAVIDGQ
ncbi:MAG: c-type cytochrome [Planctomycetaceae bacterium]|nr:c-type cytochrome [Planctomycetaceae bacterium]